MCFYITYLNNMKSLSIYNTGRFESFQLLRKYAGIHAICLTENTALKVLNRIRNK